MILLWWWRRRKRQREELQDIGQARAEMKRAGDDEQESMTDTVMGTADEFPPD